MVELTIFITLLALGYGVGRYAERRHYRDIKRREALWAHIPALTTEESISDLPVVDSGLVASSVVISIDYYKRILSGFRMFFGGELRSYASLIDRGRREALLRMREQAPDADAFLNVRLETSSISKGQKDKVAAVEVMAFATAITYAHEVRSEATD